ncbi:MAG: DUF4340 domain-containing protein [Bacteriovoracia bacterium]
MTQNPIEVHYLSGLVSIEIENKLGHYVIAKDLTTRVSYWNLTKPKQLPADGDIINKIIATLGQIQVKKTYPNDPINRSHFSLDQPLMKIRLVTETHDPVLISFGLINPIDNSMYFMIENDEYIYQTEMITFSLESLSLADLVDPNIFSIIREDLQELAIYRGNQERGRRVLKITRLGKNWLDEKGKPIPLDNINTYLDSLLKIKRQIVLDEMSKRTTRLIDSYLKRPAYEIILTDKSNNTYNYKVSGLVTRSIPELKIERRQFYLMHASDRKFPYVVNKSSLSLFNLKSYQLHHQNFTIRF